jgi:copper chaperone CopZ
MKKIMIFLLLAFVAFACNSNQTEKKDVASTSTAVANKTINLAIEGMSCEGCENTIKEAVGGVNGVMEVTASFKTGEALVKFDSTKTDIKSISNVITDAGYVVKGEKPAASTPPSAN